MEMSYPQIQKILPNSQELDSKDYMVVLEGGIQTSSMLIQYGVMLSIC